jgi:SAM-dependent methyltransferase
LLAHNFNLLWCWALNDDRKERVDYFAMQHADIEPQDLWLDVLIDEMEAKNLDVLGVVAPIKDVRGVTSIALDKTDGTTWRPHCRLTMHEVMRLPETFTSEDVGGHPILLNTGLWVCRFDPAWTRKVRFTINDRIIVDPDGDFIPEVEPEDWYFSRLLHEQGLKVGCTRKVDLGHRGGMVFGNGKAWGNNKYDVEYLERSVLDVDLDDGWFPSKAAGWLTEDEGRELARIADGKVVLEVGSFCGRSTVCLARTAHAVTAVDTFDGRGTATQGDTLGTFLKNLDRYGVRDRVEPVRGESSEVLPDLPPIYDVVFIDASHDYESVKRDAELALGRLKPGGVLAFHDYGDRDPGVVRCVDELITGGAELLSRCDSLAVIRPTLVPSTVGV